MNDVTGNINIDGEVFEGVSMSPSDVFGWLGAGHDRPPRRRGGVPHPARSAIVWVLEGSSHGPLR